MNTQELKHKFNIVPCTNKLRTISFGKLMLGLTIANSNSWDSLTISGNNQTDYFSLTKIESQDGYRFYRLIAWKINLVVAWVA